jgi:hypothetical protein
LNIKSKKVNMVKDGEPSGKNSDKDKDKGKRKSDNESGRARKRRREPKFTTYTGLNETLKRIFMET